MRLGIVVEVYGTLRQLSFPHLLVGYLTGTLDADEQAQLSQWLEQAPHHRQELRELEQLWQQAPLTEPLTRLDTAADWQKVSQQLNLAPRRTRVRRLPVLRQWAAAAAVALLLVASWLIFTNRTDPATPVSRTFVAQDTLTTVTLPDGSQVYLNADAQLAYEEDFGATTRRVTLSGEGYFEVAHNPLIPFLIHTEATTVRVVGTTFNVDAADSAVRITVNSGKVAFSHQEDTLLLTRDAVGLYQSNTQTLQTFRNDNPNYLAWKTGRLVFDSTPFPRVVQDLQKQYDIPIRIADEELRTLTFTGTFDREPLEAVLRELSMVLGANYSYQNNQIIFL